LAYLLGFGPIVIPIGAGIPWLSFDEKPATYSANGYHLPEFFPAFELEQVSDRLRLTSEYPVEHRGIDRFIEGMGAPGER
jgi:hypothetical protein